jgi:hypothetical protein
MKVYCYNCCNIVKRYSGKDDVIDCECKYKDNIRAKDTWYKIEYEYKQKPNELNKNNDCKYYNIFREDK